MALDMNSKMTKGKNDAETTVNKHKTPLAPDLHVPEPQSLKLPLFDAALLAPFSPLASAPAVRFVTKTAFNVILHQAVVVAV